MDFLKDNIIYEYFFKIINFLKFIFIKLKETYSNIKNSNTVDNINKYLITLLKDVGGISIREKYSDKMDRMYSYSKTLPIFELSYTIYYEICKFLGDAVHNTANIFSSNPITKKLDIDKDFFDIKDKISKSRARTFIELCKHVMDENEIDKKYTTSYLMALSTIYPFYLLLGILKKNTNTGDRVVHDFITPMNKSKFLNFGNTELFEKNTEYYSKNVSLTYTETKILNNVEKTVRKLNMAETDIEKKYIMSIEITKLFFGFLLFYLSFTIIQFTTTIEFISKLQTYFILFCLLLTALVSIITAISIDNDDKTSEKYNKYQMN